MCFDFLGMNLFSDKWEQKAIEAKAKVREKHRGWYKNIAKMQKNIAKKRAGKNEEAAKKLVMSHFLFAYPCTIIIPTINPNIEK